MCTDVLSEFSGRKDWGGRGAKPKLSSLYFKILYDQTRLLGSRLNVLWFWPRRFVCLHALQRLGVPLAAVMDMPLPPPPHHVWHVGDPWEGRSLISTSFFPLYSWASAAATSEALTQVAQGIYLHFHPPLLDQEHCRYSLNLKKCCKMPVQSLTIELLKVSWDGRARMHPFALSVLPYPEQIG